MGLFIKIYKIKCSVKHSLPCNPTNVATQDLVSQISQGLSDSLLYRRRNNALADIGIYFVNIWVHIIPFSWYLHLVHWYLLFKMYKSILKAKLSKDQKHNKPIHWEYIFSKDRELQTNSLKGISHGKYATIVRISWIYVL